jgi:hypothetical protein
MIETITPLPNTSSWRGAQLKKKAQRFFVSFVSLKAVKPIARSRKGEDTEVNNILLSFSSMDL